MELLIQIIFAVAITIGIYKTLQHSVDSVGEDVSSQFRKINLSFYKLDSNQLEILETNFGNYMNSLSHEEKLTFKQKVAKFIKAKTFIDRGGMAEVLVHQKVLVAACAIQVTFGFPDIFLRHYKRVLLYPTGYGTTEVGLHQNEHENLRETLVLSRDNFLKDYSGTRNLSLYEMAHALVYQNYLGNKEYNLLSDESLNDLKHLMGVYKLNLEHPVYQLLGIDALGNIYEFFAIAVENFFERPHILRESTPELHMYISRILRQNLSQLK
ncbi:MAG: Mlc titration factor MtfA (ptsG expression regulator) [Arcticibacterium sp.]|jgi:Mlc titration factor MtfA (ptsG expression regulator)